ncbi:MAG: hypothetical protein AAF568_13790, partial [Pseudomonadota bacterium]
AIAMAALVAGCSAAPFATHVGEYQYPPHKRVVATSWTDCEGGCAAQIRGLAGGTRPFMAVYMGGPILQPVNYFGTNCHLSDLSVVEGGETRPVELFGPTYEAPIRVSLTQSELASLGRGATLSAIFMGCGGETPETREISFDPAQIQAVQGALVPAPPRI